MPKVVQPQTEKMRLYLKGRERVEQFCLANDLLIPSILKEDDEWFVNACAYYRACKIHISLKECAHQATEGQVRNWNWWGSTTDREPGGVLCHELGHHADMLAGNSKGRYYSDYGESVMGESGEPPITSYCPNPAEWFAEMFRLFVTNAALLKLLRLKTYFILLDKWKPVSDPSWIAELGNCPPRILSNLRKKVACAKGSST